MLLVPVQLDTLVQKEARMIRSPDIGGTDESQGLGPLGSRRWYCETFLGQDEMSLETRGRKFFLRYSFVLVLRHSCCERLSITDPLTVH
jgi:hypothetical protein